MPKNTTRGMVLIFCDENETYYILLPGESTDDENIFTECIKEEALLLAEAIVESNNAFSNRESFYSPLELDSDIYTFVKEEYLH